jgi:hypothetical protein
MRPNNVNTNAILTHPAKTERHKLTDPLHQITTALALALGIILPSTTLATATGDQSQLPATNAIANDANANLLPKTTTTLTLTAYEFPFCLASDAEILQDFFISRPTHTNLTFTDPPSFASPNGKCVAINASKGIPHSFYYTVSSSTGASGGQDNSGTATAESSCRLVTFEKEGCEGKATPHSLREEVGEGGRPKCFSRPDRFVKALLRSARIECS